MPGIGNPGTFGGGSPSGGGGGGIGGFLSGLLGGAAGGPFGALLGIGTGVGGFLADLFGGPDREAWAPEDQTLDDLYGSAYRDILQRQHAMPDLAEGLWGSLGSFIPTDQPLTPIMEAYMMGGPRRDQFNLLNLGQNASAAAAGIASGIPPPSQGIGQFGQTMAQTFFPYEPEMPADNTQQIMDLFMQLAGQGGQPQTQTGTTQTGGAGNYGFPF